MRRIALVCAVCILGAVAGVMAADEKGRMTTGQVKSIDAQALVLELTQDDGDTMTFQVDPTAVIRLHGPKGKLSQLKPGDVVTVTYVMREGKPTATQIQHM
jgi:Cu/Ag efflux protein CusF